MKTSKEKQGYIKLNRKILTWQHWGEPRIVTVFLSLLLVANSKSRWWKGYRCNRGETMISIESLMNLCHMSRATVYKAIKSLEKSGEIKREKLRNKSIKTILMKYNEYQQDNNFFETKSIKNELKTRHKQEGNNIYNTNIIIDNVISITRAREIFEAFFTGRVLLESFCKNEGISVEQFRNLGEQVLTEWELNEVTHSSERDLRNHLLNSIRKKKEKRNLINDDMQKRLLPLIRDCKKLISEGYPADDVREFYSYWTQPMNDDSGRLLFEGIKAFDAETKFIKYFRNKKK